MKRYFFLILLIITTSLLYADTHTAASASQSHVQEAVNDASDGDTVLIPDGNVTWTTGIETTKQIIIRAENYTPTPAGTQGDGANSRNVTITNNSTVPLFKFTSGNDYHCGIGGIAFEEGTQQTNYLEVSGNGSKVPLMFDCWVEVAERFGAAVTAAVVDWKAVGGVMWNCVITHNGNTGFGGNSGPGGTSLLLTSSRAWTTADTLGTNDTNGNVNVYWEDCTFINIGAAPDLDNNARIVVRNCVLDGTWGFSHGPTSETGGRHMEYYDNEFTVSTEERNMSGRYVWIRAGTGVFTDNSVDDSLDTYQDDTMTFVEMGEGDFVDPAGIGPYPIDRQPGGGHNGTSYEVDPIYIWGNTGSRSATTGIQGAAWVSYIQEDRDYFVSSDDTDARPGYSKYTYPHPFRDVIQANVITASSASLTDVQTAVDEAGDGDTVLIPDGTATWTAPLNIGAKQIVIRAENYTPTASPTASTERNVVITYSGTTGFAIDMDSDNDFHCGVGGIEFRPSTLGAQSGGSGIWGYVHFGGSGSKPPFLFDCHFVGNERNGVTASEAAFVSIDSLGGIIWNCFFDGTQVDDGLAGGGGNGMSGAGFHLSSPRSWTTASTMGTADTGGLVNVYIEDCVFDWWGQMDVDDNGRLVVRNTTQYGCSWQTHGFTSATGGRHVEQYDCILDNSKTNRNHNRWFWLRAGTVLFTDNSVDNTNAGFGVPELLDIGDNTTPSGPYPVNRQPGYGHNGTSHVSDPIHIWGNTGGSATAWQVNGDWDEHVVEDRDIFVSADDTNAKAGWSKYTYPHPLRNEIESGGTSKGNASAINLLIR